MADPQPPTGRRSPALASLRLDADLTFSTATPTGDVTVGRLSGHGDTVTLHLERPDLMGAGLDRRAVGRIADGLAAGGLSVRVVGAHGPVAVLGRSAGSRLGGWVTGSPSVTVPPSRATLRAGWAVLGPAARRRAVAGLAAVGVGVLLRAVRRR